MNTTSLMLHKLFQTLVWILILQLLYTGISHLWSRDNPPDCLKRHKLWSTNMSLIDGQILVLKNQQQTNKTNKTNKKQNKTKKKTLNLTQYYYYKITDSNKYTSKVPCECTLSFRLMKVEFFLFLARIMNFRLRY